MSMEYYGNPMSPEERMYLAHYGKKGMKWGVRSAKQNAFGNTKADLRRMNRDNRKADRAADQEGIWKSREGLSAQRAQYKQAKAQYKIDKQRVGSYAAKKALSKHRNTYYNEAINASRSTNRELGAQIAGSLIAGPFGGTVAGVGMQIHDQRKRNKKA